jgi:hypothetical protein
MKTKLTFLIAAIAILAISFGCKNNKCCTPPKETNTIVALKNNAEWRTDGYLTQYHARKDTVLLWGTKGDESLTMQFKKTGDGYTLIDAHFTILLGGDVIMATYILDTSKSNTFSTITNTNDLMEGTFELNFKLTYGYGTNTYPGTVVFKGGQFKIRWDHVYTGPLAG